MEKLILIGIAVWISFMFTDGFQPPRPVKKPDKQKTEISKPEPSRPGGEKSKWIRTHYD